MKLSKFQEIIDIQKNQRKILFDTISAQEILDECDNLNLQNKEVNNGKHI